MSQYADYNHTSQDYDTTRIPVGVDSILACLARTGIPLSEQTVLEAGCGTGNYLQALCPHLGSLVGVDINERMLAEARAKLGERVELTCGSILDLHYENQSFDGITCNQVIHHLEEGPGKADNPATWKPCGFANVARFIRETYRVLSPAGALVVNTSTHAQLRDGFWWAELIPLAVARLRYRLPDLDRLTRILAAAGFEIESVTADLDGTLQGPSYLDPMGPLSAAWRAGDSSWSLASDEELENARRRVKRMNDAGTLYSYVDQREQKRRAIGQTTFVCCRK